MELGESELPASGPRPEGAGLRVSPGLRHSNAWCLSAVPGGLCSNLPLPCSGPARAYPVRALTLRLAFRSHPLSDVLVPKASHTASSGKSQVPVPGALAASRRTFSDRRALVRGLLSQQEI